jgi:polysaccharide pyruvyl transferase WcaK-like protein
MILSSILDRLGARPDIDITVLTNTPTLTQEVHNVRVADSSMRHYSQAVHAIRNSDFILWAGGNMLQEQFSYLHIPLAARDLLQGRIFDKKMAIYGVEVGPIVSPMGRFLAKMVLLSADMIAVRNIQSYREAMGLGAKEQVLFLTQDPIFSISTDNRPDIDRILGAYNLDRGPMVGICPRILFERRLGYLPFGFRKRYGLLSDEFLHGCLQVKDFMIRICSFLNDEANMEVIFLPMDMNDESLCDEIIETLRGGTKISLSSLTLKEVSDVFGAVDLVVSMRLHGLMLASRLGIPVINISGVTKNMNFLSQLGYDNNNVDLEGSSLRKFKDVFDSIWCEREKVKDEIHKKTALMKKQEEDKFKVLMSYIETGHLAPGAF